MSHRRINVPSALLNKQDETLTALPMFVNRLWNEQFTLDEKLDLVTLADLNRLYTDAKAKGLEDQLDGHGFPVWAMVTQVATWNADVPAWVTDYWGRQVPPVIDPYPPVDPENPDTRPRKVSELVSARVVSGVGYVELAMPFATPRDDGGYNGIHSLSLKTIRRAAGLTGITLIDASQVPDPE